MPAIILSALIISLRLKGGRSFAVSAAMCLKVPENETPLSP